MPRQYTVKSGDNLSSIARRHGFSSWRDIYFHNDNADFRRKRPNPDLIFPGDIVMIPDANPATPAQPNVQQTVTQSISVGSVSWINETPHPLSAAGFGRLVLEPNWVFDTYVGLVATSNPEPPAQIADFRAYQNGKHFRSLMFCQLELKFEQNSRQLRSLRVVNAVHDGGWTPPFNTSKVPATMLAEPFDDNISDRRFHQGEASPESRVFTERRHENSTLGAIAAGETVLVNGIIKFRAGKHTDDIGINVVESPFHVPWVWCEMLLTYANGQFKLYGNGSQFPSHAWYFNGRRVHHISQLSDAAFPIRSSGLIESEIDLQRLRIYPVLNKGAPASGPQVGLATNAGAVNSHPYTVDGQTAFTKLVAP